MLTRAPQDAACACKHEWVWGDGREAGTAICRICRYWTTGASIEYVLSERLALAMAVVEASRPMRNRYCACNVCELHSAALSALDAAEKGQAR